MQGVKVHRKERQKMCSGHARHIFYYSLDTKEWPEGQEHDRGVLNCVFEDIQSKTWMRVCVCVCLFGCVDG